LRLSVLSHEYCESLRRDHRVIAAGTTPDTIVSFRPSPATKTRVSALIHQEKTIGLSSEEKSELDNYMQLEHLMRFAKARAHKTSPMRSYVSEELRRLVANRAERLCEYCLIHEDDTFFGCVIDHIVRLCRE
jgi:hypothetical protein